LYQNYPNPFNPSTAINYQLLANCYIQLKVFDTLGRQIETLVDGIIPKGRHTVHWDALKVASGVYFYSLRYDNKVITKKMVVVK
jgi:hypothetical protein